MLYPMTIAILAAVLSAVNLLLTIGVIRRLKEHSSLLADGTAATPEMPRPGTPIAEFEAQTVDGRAVTLGSLRDGCMVAFFSPGCEACEDVLPALSGHLRATGASPESAVVVIAAELQEALPMVHAFEGTACVIVEPPPRRELRKAFGITAFPTVVTISGGAIGSLVDPFRLDSRHVAAVG